MLPKTGQHGMCDRFSREKDTGVLTAPPTKDSLSFLTHGVKWRYITEKVLKSATLPLSHAFFFLLQNFYAQPP